MDIEKLSTNYQANQVARDVLMASRVLLLVGISGAGKDTIQSQLLKNEDYHKIVTHTTRQPRENDGVMEQSGREYHFVNKDEMASLLERHEMIEINHFSGNYYGTSVQEFRRANEMEKVAVGNIDVNGVASFRAIASDTIHALFIVPPSFDEWCRRLKGRYASEQEFDAKFAGRREEAKNELTHALSVPYYHFIINDTLDRAVRVVDEIAHRKDTFNRHDDEARAAARNLLESICNL